MLIPTLVTGIIIFSVARQLIALIGIGDIIYFVAQPPITQPEGVAHIKEKGAVSI